MPRLNLSTLRNLYQLVSERREGPMTVKVKSFYTPSHEWLFSAARLSEYRVFIGSLLSQLPKGFLQSRGAEGLPWFSAVRLCNDVQWGGLDDADKLLAIARAASMVKSHTPLADCDVPYCVILDDDIRASERALPSEQQHRQLLYWSFFVAKRSNS